ncbi:MAG: hypothetical protein V1867_05530 [Candidatus Falkowbacteria bacterium]
MDKKDLQQISCLIKEELKENNKKIFEKIDEKIDDLAITVNQSIGGLEEGMGRVENRLDKVENRLDKVESTNDKIYKSICSYTDNELAGLQTDMDKTKYLHIEEWKKLPSSASISAKLVEKGLK